MSKLYNNYLYLKANEVDASNTLYLFKSGLFFIFLAEDAKKASTLLHLKLTYFAENVVKCGFPINSLEKYTNILKKSPYNFKIVDNTRDTYSNIQNCSLNDAVKKLLIEISSINTDTLSIKEAYNFIDSIKNSSQYIIEMEKYNAK